jgi:hypothetical protein
MTLKRISFWGLALFTLGLCLIGCGSGSSTNTTPAAVNQTNSEVAGTVPRKTASLSAEIENVSLYPVPNNPRDLAVSLVVTVRNTGSPANADKWTLVVNSPNRETPLTVDPVHVNGLIEMPGRPGVKVDIGKEDLALKSKETPITKGAPLNGILTFVLPGVSAKDISNNSSSLVVHFRDSDGGSYQTLKATVGKQR